MGGGGLGLDSSKGRLILLATVLASGSAFLTASMVNIALPSVQSFFGSELSGIQWVANAQLLTLAALLPIGGALGDRFGRKRLSLIGIAVFSFSAVLAAISPSISFLIAFQAIGGIGSALAIPQNLAIINVNFDERRRGQVIGWWAGFAGIISALGPWLGGWLVQSFSWRAVFLLALLLGIITFTVVSLAVPESRNDRSRRIDWPGTLLLFAGLLGISYGLIAGPSGWTSPFVMLALLEGLAAFVAFLLVELNREEPLVEFAIFKSPRVYGANLLTLLLYAALSGIVFFCILDMQQARDYSPAFTGLALLPSTGIIALLSGPAGSLADKIGPRLQTVLGPALVGAGAALLAFSAEDKAYLSGLLPGIALTGIGMSLVIAPLTRSALSVDPSLSGIASGVNNAVSRIAGLLAIAALGAMMLSIFTASLNGDIAASGLPPVQQGEILGQVSRLGGIVIPGSFSPAAEIIARQAISVSYTEAFRTVMFACSALAFGGAAVSFFTIRNR